MVTLHTALNNLNSTFHALGACMNDTIDTTKLFEI